MKKQILPLLAAALAAFSIFLFMPVATSAEAFTSFDALNILKYSVGGLELAAEQEAKYDANGDGVINVADALAVLRDVLGLNDRPIPPETQPPGLAIPAVMVDGVLYSIQGGFDLDIEIDEADYLGRITSFVASSGLPKENGQTNAFPTISIGSPYAKYGEDIVVWYGGRWRVFERMDNR